MLSLFPLFNCLISRRRCTPLSSDQIHIWYEKHKTGIYRYILSMTHDRQLAEDVLQDTFVQLLTDGIRFEPGREQAWLYRVARNKCFNILKRQKKQSELQSPAVASENLNWEFLEMIAPLSAKEQEIVTLKMIGGFSHKEIAKITGKTVAATKKCYERAIQKLREEMEATL